VRDDRAFYRLADDTITLPEREQFSSGDRFYVTALHEIGHSVEARIMPHGQD
jgi:putative DNA primase/helicase